MLPYNEIIIAAQVAEEAEKRRGLHTATEHQEQAAFFKQVRFYRELGYEPFESICAVPNGGERRDPIAGANLTAEGVEPGVPDVLVLHYGLVKSTRVEDAGLEAFDTYGYMSIEFKRDGRQGDKSAILDYCLGPKIARPLGAPVPSGGLSDYQLAWATTVSLGGGYPFVAYTWLQAWNAVCDYLGYPQFKER